MTRASSRIRKSIYIIFGVTLLLLISTMLFSNYTIRRVEENMKIQVHTRTVIIALKDNLTLLLNAETEERGFVITGDSSFLKLHDTEIQKINSTTKQIRALVSDNPAQMVKMDTLEHLIQLKISRIRSLIALKKQAQEKNIRDQLVDTDWKSVMDTIQAVNQRMQDIEAALFKDRIARTNNSVEIAGNIFKAEALLSLLIIVLLAATIASGLRKRAIAEKKIIEYNIALQAKNSEIEQFAYVASHDLQEPLRSITNFSRLLIERLKNTPDKEAKEYASFMSRATERMSSLIFDLLQYSRIGKDMTQSRVDCNKLVAELLKDMEAAIKDSHAEIHVAKLPVITGYEYLRSLFQNLISNAIKFATPGKYPVIDISVAEQENEYLFSVKDNGIGIDKLYYERVFIIFQRLHGRGEYPGTGIGLSQCKKIVELHGGKIWVDSEHGQGTTFYFTIPKT
jgi:signal transduction histidine kinase